MTTSGILNKNNHEDINSHSHDHDHSHISLFGHNHTHSAQQPNKYLMSGSIKSNPAVRITWIGLLVNISLAVSKGFGGVYFHSQALIADAIHSVSDMVADFLTLATVNVASKIGTPTKFPLGYGKIETVGSLLVSGVLLFAGISVGWSSLLQIFEFTLPTYIYDYVSMIQIGHSHSHSHNQGGGDVPSHVHSHTDAIIESPTGELANTFSQVPNINAAWLAGGSIVVKELLFHKTLKVAEETNSKVLVANAWHHRVDSLTALVALVTVTGGNLFNVVWLDSIGGFLVSILIIKAGWGTFMEAFNELIDKGENVDSELYIKVKDTINTELSETESFNGFKISQLSVLSAGANTNVYVTLSTVDKDYDLDQLNKVEFSLVNALKERDSFLRNIYINFRGKKSSEIKNEIENQNQNHIQVDNNSEAHSHKH